mmetsp:Transcript_32092/g.91002  ORF Transcript_32092/g.91002 Transcript_32092/m.91002 type:complete len:101 (-) Transcript_32092:1176-1478(-)
MKSRTRLRVPPSPPTSRMLRKEMQPLHQAAQAAQPSLPKRGRKPKPPPAEVVAPAEKAKPLWSKSEDVAAFRAAWRASSEWGKTGGHGSQELQCRGAMAG